MLEKLFGFLNGRSVEIESNEQSQEEQDTKELFKLYRQDVEKRIVGLPQGGTSEEIESLRLVQIGPGTSDEDCQEFLRVICENLPPHEAKRIIVTRETDISVFRWKKVEDRTNGKQ